MVALQLLTQVPLTGHLSYIVTVRKTQNDGLTFDHVLLTFGFDTAVTLTSVVLDLFLCREWNIGAGVHNLIISVYANTFAFNESMNVNLYRYPIPPNQPSACVSLSTIDILFQRPQAQSSYTTWHILFYQIHYNYI